MPLEPFEGPVWRLLPVGLAETPAAPAAAPEGRFHHLGQTAAYASLSVEGTRVAIQRYLSDGVSRVLIPMWLSAPIVADIRGDKAASIVWQDIRRKVGTPSPTWRYSDAARNAGALAMLYSSRSRPDLSHVVVFEPHCLSYVGPISRFEY
ncbi:RES family NAD+ phosphorylase [Altericroceibacterium xinjiangense]|uniref:RES family NAD+ phosphorylase n=1 Tax=Altericroceibacterium xinjiangense TaxID=762261 RepID=UPI003B96CDD6